MIFGYIGLHLLSASQHLFRLHACSSQSGDLCPDLLLEFYGIGDSVIHLLQGTYAARVAFSRVLTGL